MVNVMLISIFKALPTALHDEKLSQISKIHLQEIVLLQLLELDTSAQELDCAASFVTPEPLCGIGAQLGRLSRESVHCESGLVVEPTGFLSFVTSPDCNGSENCALVHSFHNHDAYTAEGSMLPKGAFRKILLSHA